MRDRSCLRAALGLSLLLLAVLAAAPASADRKLVSHLDLAAYVADDFACAPQVLVGVISNTAASFSGERQPLQRLVGGIRATLGFECPAVEDIVMIGIVGQEAVWRGLVSKKNGWVLVDLPMDDDGQQDQEQQQDADGDKSDKPVVAGIGKPLTSFGGGTMKYGTTGKEPSSLTVMP